MLSGRFEYLLRERERGQVAGSKQPRLAGHLQELVYRNATVVIPRDVLKIIGSWPNADPNDDDLRPKPP